MAKLKAPLLSLGASGQVGKALVFFGWKGLNLVREYVVPANPQTPPQNAQRALLTEAVAKIHEVQALAAHPLDSVDIMAYAAWASVVKAATTWFNQVVKNWVDSRIDLKTPCIYADGEVTDTTVASIDMVLFFNPAWPGQPTAGKFFFGTSKTALIHPKTAVVAAGASASLVAEDCTAIFTAGIKYFWQFKPDAGEVCEGALSGIYYFVAS